jgi:hypothetical protein
MQALAKGDVKTCKAIERAHLHFFKWNFKRSKQHDLQKIKLHKLAGVYNGSIVKKFFIEKKKTFSEIVGFKK